MKTTNTAAAAADYVAQCEANKAATGYEYGYFCDTSGNPRVEQINPRALYPYHYRTDAAPAPKDIQGSYITPDGKAQIDFGITHRNGYPEFTATGHFNGASGQCLDSIAAAYPKDVAVRRLTAYWQKHHLKNVSAGVVRAILWLSESYPARDFYATQADTFLSRNGLKLRATLSNTKTPPWSKDGQHGHHYRVTVSRAELVVCQACKGSRIDAHLIICPLCKGSGKNIHAPLRLTFDFWDSLNDAASGTHPSAYTVLACISSDSYTPETFKDYCDEYGYDPDSIKALQTFRRCSAFARRLRAFFTPAELEQLAEIR